MGYYLAERYMAAPSSRTLISEASTLGAAGDGVTQLVLTLYSAEDEVCFYLFDAPSADEVRRAGDLAGLGIERVVSVVGLGGHEIGRRT